MKHLIAVAVIAAAVCANTFAADATHDAWIIKRVPPTYDRTSIASDIEGCVVVAFRIGADGHAADLEVVDAVPGELFEKATLEAVKQWQFQPATKPCAGRYYQQLSYQIDNSGGRGIKTIRPCKIPTAGACPINGAEAQAGK